MGEADPTGKFGIGRSKSEYQVDFFRETLVCHFCRFRSFHGSRVQNACVTLPRTDWSSGNPWHGVVLAWVSTASILQTQTQSARGKLSIYVAWNIKISHCSKSGRAETFYCHCCFPSSEEKSHLLSDVVFDPCGSRYLRDYGCTWQQQGEARVETAVRAWHGRGLRHKVGMFHCVLLRDKVNFGGAWKA